MNKVIVEILSHISDRGFVKIRCPFHDDHHPSGSILFRDGKPVLIRCFAGCSARRVMDYQWLDARRLVLTVVEAESRASRPGKTKRSPKKTPAQSENREWFADPSAIQLIREIVMEEAEAILNNRFVESPDAIRFWDSFMQIKQVPKAWINLEKRPICGVGLHYPIQVIDALGETVPVTAFQIRTNTDALKSLYHPRVELPDGAVRIYSPYQLNLTMISKPIIITEAPHHALRIAALGLDGLPLGLDGLPLGLDVLPIAACGLSNLQRVYELLSSFGKVVAVFADESPSASQPICALRIVDLDRIDNPTLVSMLISLIQSRRG